MSAASGIDVSVYQGTVNWQQVRAAGKRFAICRSTIGDSYRDPTWLPNAAGIRSAGMAVGSYHVFKPSDDAEAQIENWYRTVGKLQDGDLCPWIDAERTESVPGSSRVDLGDLAQALAMCVVYAEERFGKPIGIYTAGWFWNQLPASQRTRFSHLPLWAATYNNTPGIVTKPYGWSTYHIHQYSSTGRVAGISGNVDLNYCPNIEAITRHDEDDGGWKAAALVSIKTMRDELSELEVAIRKAGA